MSALKTIACLGDSQTDSDAGYGVHGFDTWPAVLQRSLRLANYDVRVRSFGVSGDTTAQMLARANDLFIYGRPDCVVIYGGVNDPGASITQAATQANIQAIIKAVKHRAVGDGLGSGPSVTVQGNLPAGGALGQRYVVLADTSSNGGQPASDPQHHPTITTDMSGAAQQTVWEYRYGAAGTLGWGRVAVASTAPLKDTAGALLGCPNVVVLSTNYLNFTTGGDTPSTPNATNAPVRTAQAAAVTAEAATGATISYADLYATQKALITGGQVADFTGGYVAAQSWHYKQDNQHHNAFGHSLVAVPVRSSAALTAALA